MQHNIKHPVKVQIAFQGGGAKIFAMVAALESLYKLRESNYIRITRVAGSSAGSIIASLCAANVSIEDVRKAFSQLPDGFNKLPKNKWWRIIKLVPKILIQKKSIYKEELLYEILNKVSQFENKNIKDLQPDFLNYPELIITSSDLKVNQQKTWSNSPNDNENINLIDAIVNSCRIPIVFSENRIIPKKKNKENHNWLYDGGITGNLPVQHLIDKVHEYGSVIAITFNSNGSNIDGLFDLVGSTVFSSIDAHVSEQLNKNHVLRIDLDAKGVTMLDFNKAIEILKLDANDEDTKLYNENRDKTMKSILHFLENRLIFQKDIKRHKSDLVHSIPKVEDLIINNETINKRLICYKYGPIDYTSDEFKAIKKILPQYKSKPLDGRYIDAFQTQEHAILSEMVYSFPFFLTKFRRKYWGVIPYGNHRAIGLLIHKNHTFEFGKQVLLENKNELLLKHQYKKVKKEIFNTTENIGSNHWINALINQVFAKNGKIFSTSGYLFNEIIPLMILEAKNPEAINNFLLVKEERSPENLIQQFDFLNPKDEGNIPNTQPIEKVFTQILKDFVNSVRFKNRVKFINSKIENHVLLFDLEYRNYIENFIESNRDYEMLELAHYLDIPVGFGFTLTAFDQIEKKWEKLVGLLNKLAENKKNEFLKSGIEIN